jgi:hypothetical protein
MTDRDTLVLYRDVFVARGGTCGVRGFFLWRKPTGDPGAGPRSPAGTGVH